MAHSRDSSSLWYRDAIYNRYWSHYEAACDWMNKHWQVQRHFSANTVAQPRLPPPPPVPRWVRRDSIIKRRKRRRKRGPSAIEISYEEMKEEYAIEVIQEVESQETELDVVQDELMEEEAVHELQDGEMTAEMRAFFRQTVLHKLEHEHGANLRHFYLKMYYHTTLPHPGDTVYQNGEKAKKAEEGQNSCWYAQDDDLLLADKIGFKLGGPTTLPPERRSTQEKMTKARQLYGEDAERVNAMEILMRMKFNQEHNKSKTPFWPNIPLKL